MSTGSPLATLTDRDTRSSFPLTTLSPLAEVHHLILHHLESISPTTLLPINTAFYSSLLPSIYRSIHLNSSNVAQLFYGFKMSRSKSTLRKNRALSLVENIHFEDESSLRTFYRYGKVTPSRHNPIFPGIKHVHLGWDAVVGMAEKPFPVRPRGRPTIPPNRFARSLSFILGYHMSTTCVETISLDWESGRLSGSTVGSTDGLEETIWSAEEIQGALADLISPLQLQKGFKSLIFNIASGDGDFAFDPTVILSSRSDIRVFFNFDEEDTGYELDLGKAGESIVRVSRLPSSEHRIRFVSNRAEDLGLQLEKMYEGGSISEEEIRRLRESYQVEKLEGTECACKMWAEATALESC
ncbi:hypothetical protein IAR55_005526 [Kwoniella newhampshirensis]|uniref:F-box domain-containing protein n=1 Tax=Kwoniella newhampshirensis TaxID=1651941 RepID=A0AAW0YHL6_9TREE